MRWIVLSANSKYTETSSITTIIIVIFDMKTKNGKLVSPSSTMCYGSIQIQQSKYYSGVSVRVHLWIKSSNKATCWYKPNETSPNKHHELWTNISFNLTSSSHFKTLFHTLTYESYDTTHIIHHTHTASVQCAGMPIVLSIYLRRYACAD